MSFYHKSLKRKQAYEDYPRIPDEEMLNNLCRSNTGPMSPKGQLDQEKRVRREIANSNERRRMQSINAGFNSLKILIPHPEGEKLSKAAILQQTAEYINNLQQEKDKLASQNCHLKRLLGDAPLAEEDFTDQASPPPKRKKRDTESSDEGINMPQSDKDSNQEDLKKEMNEIRGQLDRERCLRMMLEDQMRRLKSQLYPEKLHHIANQVSAQMRHEVLRQRHLSEERRKQGLPDVIKEEVEPTSPCVPEPDSKAFLKSCPSRRNLDMIVEAIRHLEGDHVLLDHTEMHRDIPNSEDSEKESTITLSDHEDCKSDSLSGCDMPQGAPQNQLEATVHVQHSVLLGDRYQATTQLLHQPLLPSHYLGRPGVIVQKTT